MHEEFNHEGAEVEEGKERMGSCEIYQFQRGCMQVLDILGFQISLKQKATA
jgi:hypothetical protein